MPARHSLLAAAATLLLAVTAAAQAPVSKDTHHAAGGWKEMDAFHMVMMETWHPARGATRDLAPIRAKASALAEAARVWAAAPAPAACADSAARAAVAGVAADAGALQALVAARASSDSAVYGALRALHDRFEPLAHRCSTT